MTTQDSTLLRLRQQADLKFDQATARKTLEERRNQQLMVAYKGGLFKATPELISFVASWPGTDMYLADVYEQPIWVLRAEFHGLLLEAYHAAMNDWHQEYEKLSQVRKPNNV